MATERTPLHPTGSTPSYMVSSDDEDAYYSPRNRNLKQFQCCVCTSLMTAFFAVIIVAICYSILNPGKLPLVSNTTNLLEDLNGTIYDENSTEILLSLLSFPIEDEPDLPWAGPNLTSSDQGKAIEEAQIALIEKEALEEKLRPPPALSPTYKHQKAVATSLKARLMARDGFIEDHATRFIIEKNGLKKKGHRWNVGQGPEVQGALGNNEPKSICNFNSKYRTSNGTCNNKKYPHTFGVAFRPFRRAINPDYADGISAPRSSINGQPLPSARQVSLQIHRPSYETDPQFTVMLAVWGQFLDHDITATALTQAINGVPLECCNVDPSLPLHPECFPVPITPDDPFYQQFNITCMNFVRSSPAPTGKMSPREQLNQATAFIDGSVVYGNTDEKQHALRSGYGGKLKMLQAPETNRSLLPVSDDPNDGCNRDEMNSRGHYCFDSGDTRANENLHLTSMHLIWARQHNHIVENLARINPHWSDERLFQEGRKILGAQMQHITYNEFLTVVLGKEVSKKFSIISNPESARDLYNDTLDPSIANHFASAAFRFAHTLLPRLFFLTRDTSSPEGIAMHKMLFNPYSLYNDNGLDNAMKSAINTPVERSDPYFNDEIKNHLFQKPTPTWNTSAPCGLDLVSLNIQRGRDHGLPPYPDFRKYCHLPAVDTWEEMSLAVDPDSLRRMQEIYKAPENVDVYTGGLSEPPLDGGILGPLFTCLIGEQFYRLKFGDSFWFERAVGPQRFTQPQLKEIYKVLLSSVICRNSDHVSFTQRYVMKRSGPTNKLEDCDRLDTFNFEPWRERPTNFSRTSMHRESSRVRSFATKRLNAIETFTLGPVKNLENVTIIEKTDILTSVAPPKFQPSNVTPTKIIQLTTTLEPELSPESTTETDAVYFPTILSTSTSANTNSSN